MKKEKTGKLPNAPLQEVIFELLWEIGFDQQGNPIDQDFEFAQGIFAKNVTKQFPNRKRTIPEGLPLKIYPKTIHQFWKGENTWPVVQIGPGIMAINETEHNYNWHDTFYPLIKQQIKNLEDSYGYELTYKNSSLRYIDAVEISKEERKDLLDLVNSKFNMSLSNDFNYFGNLSHLNLTQTFNINENTKLSLMINDGFNKFQRPAIIWQTHIISNAKMNKEKVLSWVSEAHEVTSELFKNILKREFYDSFK